jgi:Family of unknown function (DUF6064)
MSEWWSYRLSDLLMFSPETYYRLFELYNEGVWPAQIGALASGAVILALMLSRLPWSGRAVSLLLALAWLFVAYAYFYQRYATINIAAPYYALAFAAQAVLLLLIGGAAGKLTFEGRDGWVRRAGLALVLFELAVQPLIGPLLGRSWGAIELFGIAPDPTALATLGVLLAADRMRYELFVIPLAWCAVTGATLWTMQSPDALIMQAAGAIALGLALYESRRAGRETPAS